MLKKAKKKKKMSIKLLKIWNNSLKRKEREVRINPTIKNFKKDAIKI